MLSTTHRVSEDIQGGSPGHGFWKYGRFYGNGRPGKGQYVCPIDSVSSENLTSPADHAAKSYQEEQNRLDILHQFFVEVFNGHITSRDSSRERPLKVLDLGSGTGMWAVAAAETYVYPMPHFQSQCAVI
jgi:hypothetical protein